MKTSSHVITPTVKKRLRASRPMIVLVIFVVGVFLIAFMVPSDTDDDRVLSINNSAPSGARALARIMSQHGVDVYAADSADDAIARAAQPDTTLVYAFPNRSTTEVASAIRDLPDVIYVGTEQAYSPIEDATPTTVEGDGDDPDQSGGGAQPAGDTCSVAAAHRAGDISRDQYGIRIRGLWTGCYPLSKDVWAYAELSSADTFRAIIPSSLIVRNSSLADYGNASLAINAIARNPHVVWYIGDIGDTLGGKPSVLPPWLIPLVVLMSCALLTLGLSRAVQLGRLIPEDLPSYVPSAETSIGRGRLLMRSHSRTHAAQSLRTDTALRCAARLGVARTGSEEALHAALVHAGIAPIRAEVLLWGPPPTSDQDLVDLADALAQLEKDIRHD